MGLDYDPFNARINTNKVYFQGRYFLGVGHSFIKFPFDQIQINLNNTRTRTKDGLSVGVNLYYGVKLNSNLKDLLSMYSKHGETYRSVYLKLGEVAVNKVFSQYETSQLFSERGNIGLAISNQLKEYLSNESANLINLQLYDILLSDQMKNLLTEIENKNLNIQIAKNNQLVQNADMYAKKSQAFVTSNNIKEKADILRTKYLNLCKMKADMNKAYIQTIQPSLLSLKNSLGFTAKDFISYIYLQRRKNADRLNTYENIPLPKQSECIADSTLNFCN